MFEVTWWCIVVSLVLAGAVFLDARSRVLRWGVSPIVWAVVVGVTWVAIVPYFFARGHDGRGRETPLTGGASVVIRAAPEQVWSMISDVTRMGQWSPETTRAGWLDGATGPVVGARFKGHNRRGRAKWSTVCEVIDAKPGRSFAFAVGGAAKPETIWRYSFEPCGEDVRVTETFEVVKPLGQFSRLVTRVTTGVRDRQADLEAGVRSTLARVKEAAEDPHRVKTSAVD